MTPDATTVLDVSGLRKQYRVRGAGRHTQLTAVDDVDFVIRAGETVALVGESGSGKSTIARCVSRLVEPTAGRVLLDGESILDVTPRRLAAVYGDLQMVFQDPMSSLDPRMTVAATLDEPLRLHTSLDREGRRARIRALLADVELSDTLLERRPRQLSGGQRQRLSIARALAAEPKVILLDEPTASLDVSVRGQIIRLLERLQDEHGLAYLFISHDLAVVRRIADRVLVMYLGGIVEQGTTADVFEHPVHPYTRALLSAAPVVAYGRPRSRLSLAGEIPSPMNIPLGCRLVGRCPLAEEACSLARPPLEPVTATHDVACPVSAP
ncbi:ABC transporter ATP-binding protein [Frondihabitans australicus]|uniref:Peptide/nickel transport system ATP-binding protein/oligopeptide transport system ATP-binding protein n=1 Tax=Frondihabitans australicus TaxID=386892 RepID=A0A495IIR7_9MICO|nr:oligopeptide/dipeptide ABC transporter ATP-binding protein [Frondihabitans australicus]RKR75884.1 peptide/nickel transport system ATP-binding protein/oligopeptide transport system ATP-binding protein [Frondihabitans australicus]